MGGRVVSVEARAQAEVKKYRTSAARREWRFARGMRALRGAARRGVTGGSEG